MVSAPVVAWAVRMENDLCPRLSSTWGCLESSFSCVTFFKAGQPSFFQLLHSSSLCTIPENKIPWKITDRTLWDFILTIINTKIKCRLIRIQTSQFKTKWFTIELCSYVTYIFFVIFIILSHIKKKYILKN